MFYLSYIIFVVIGLYFSHFTVINVIYCLCIYCNPILILCFYCTAHLNISYGNRAIASVNFIIYYYYEL